MKKVGIPTFLVTLLSICTHVPSENSAKTISRTQLNVNKYDISDSNTFQSFSKRSDGKDCIHHCHSDSVTRHQSREKASVTDDKLLKTTSPFPDERYDLRDPFQHNPNNIFRDQKDFSTINPLEWLPANAHRQPYNGHIDQIKEAITARDKQFSTLEYELFIRISPNENLIEALKLVDKTDFVISVKNPKTASYSSSKFGSRSNISDKCPSGTFMKTAYGSVSGANLSVEIQLLECSDGTIISPNWNQFQRLHFYSTTSPKNMLSSPHNLQSKLYEHYGMYSNLENRELENIPVDLSKISGAEKLVSFRQSIRANIQAESTLESEPTDLLALSKIPAIDDALLSSSNSESKRQNRNRVASQICPQCNDGYIDISNCNANYWACGALCAGGAYWTASGTCNCACVLGNQVSMNSPTIKPTKYKLPAANSTDIKSPSPSLSPSVPTYSPTIFSITCRYVQIHISGARSYYGEGIQFAEWVFTMRGTRVDYTSAVSSWTGCSTFPGAPSLNGIDNNVYTKFGAPCSNGVFTIDFGKNVQMDGYHYITPTDFPERDPALWSILVSSDQIHYITLPTVPDQSYIIPETPYSPSPNYYIGPASVSPTHAFSSSSPVSPSVVPIITSKTPTKNSPYKLSNSPSSLALPTNNPTLTLTYTIYVQGNLPDGPGNATQCNVSPAIPQPHCSLRSAWALCLSLLSKLFPPCSFALCSIVLQSKSKYHIHSQYGSLNFNSHNMKSSCPAIIEIMGDSNSKSSKSLPVIFGDHSSTQFLNIEGLYKLYLTDLSIQNYGDGSQTGGCISFSHGYQSKIFNCEFNQNVANIGGSLFFVDVSTILISNSTFTNNIAYGVSDSNGVFGGGAVFVYSTSSVTVLITDSTFDGNNVPGLKGNGGAITIDAMTFLTFTVTNSVFTNNAVTGGGYGGAIAYGSASKLTITTSTFLNNYVNGEGGTAGAVFGYSPNSILTSSISHCLYVNNSVYSFNAYGGAVCLYSVNANLTSTITHSTFIANSATGGSGEGGAVHLYASDAYSLVSIIDNSNFINNSLSGGFGDGGAVYAKSLACSLFTTIVNSFFTNNAIFGGGNGGAVKFFAYEGHILTSNIVNCTFLNNAVISSTSSSYSAESTTSNNGDGGAVHLHTYFCPNFISNVINSTFINNTIKGYDGYGGAIYVYAIALGSSISSSSTISNSTFRDNAVLAVNGNGGAVYITISCYSYNSLASTIYNSEFTRNTVTGLGYGGAVYLFSSFSLHSTIVNSKFENNFISGYYDAGGAVYLLTSFSLLSSTIVNSTFIRNFVNGDNGAGGAMYCYSSSFVASTIASSTFIENTVNGLYGFGGAVYLYAPSSESSYLTSTITECNFDKNAVNGNFGTGGAVYASSSFEFIATNSSFKKNVVAGQNGNGGALYVFSYYSCVLRISNCLFFNNAVTGSNGNGGAVTVLSTDYSSLTSTITNNNFINNAILGGIGFGGALYFYLPSTSSFLTSIIADSNFVNNTVAGGGNGGAVYFFCTLISQISDCVFINNAVTEGVGNGGALYHSAPSQSLIAIITNSVFAKNSVNHAGYGGAIYLDTGCNSSLSGCILTGNSAGYDGGAIYLRSPTQSKLLSCSLRNNIANHNGGSVYYYYSILPVIYNTSFVKNAALNDGGAIYFDHCLSHVASITFTGNNARYYGGVIFYFFSSNSTVSNSVFNRNFASLGDGGALCITKSESCQILNSAFSQNNAFNAGAISIVDSSRVVVQNSQFSSNTALYDSGAIEYVKSSFSVLLDCTFYGNAAASYYSKGGAISYVQDSSDAIIINNNFSKNTAYSAGAIISYCDRLTITYSHFDSNHALTDGGALIAVDMNDFGSENNVFSSNSGDNNGGALLITDCVSLEFINNTFLDNAASNSGGSLYLDNSTKVGIVRSWFEKNSAAIYSGAIHSTNVTKITVLETKFISNKAQYGGALSFLRSSYTTIRYCIMQFNTADISGGAVYFNQSSNSTDIVNSMFIGNKAHYGGAITFDFVCENGLLKLSQFQSNFASYGGAISFGSFNGLDAVVSKSGKTFQINSCTLTSNIAYIEGGSVYTNQSNSVSFENTTIIRSISRDKGGAISAHRNNFVGISSSYITDCSSSSFGGAISGESENQLFLTGLNTFSYNIANNTGGAIFLNNSNFMQLNSASDVIFERNTANTGSAIYLGLNSQIKSIGISSSAVSFIKNKCLFPGCGSIFWANSDASRNESVPLLANAELSWIGNNNSFLYVSQPIVFVTNLQTYTVTYNNATSNGNAIPQIILRAYDQFQQACLSDSLSTVKVSILSSHCGSITASLSGGMNAQKLVQGETIFEGLFVTCVPGGNVTLIFTGTIFDTSETFNTISSTININFPPCNSGEEALNGVCRPKPLSSSQSSDAYIITLASSLPSVGIGLPLCIVLLYYLIAAITLRKLPTHYALRKRKGVDHVLETIKLAPSLTFEKAGGKTALEIALEMKANSSIIRALVLIALPVDPSTKNVTSDAKKLHVWSKFIQSDDDVSILDSILSDHHDIALLLFQLKDDKGRHLVHQATPQFYKCLEDHTHFLKRFIFSNRNAPEHRSDTCIVHIATDKTDEDQLSSSTTQLLGKKVALKFMKSYEMFSRELAARSQNKISDLCVIGVICSYDSKMKPSANELDVEKYFELFGFTDYKYLIVMPAADRTLSTILANENIAGKDITLTKSIALDIVTALAHIHSSGIIHGDVKPSNIMRLNGKMILIDMDASASIGNEYAAAKFSSGYCPPEVIHVSDDGMSACIKSPLDARESESKVLYDPVLANASFDAWSLGVLFYELFTGRRLFDFDNDGNVDADSLRQIYQFDDQYKQEKLKIVDESVRSIISQLLERDPCNRPAMIKLIHHHFFSSYAILPYFNETSEVTSATNPIFEWADVFVDVNSEGVLLGEGGYSTVIRAIVNPTGNLSKFVGNDEIVIKILSKASSNFAAEGVSPSEQLLQAALSEVRVIMEASEKIGSKDCIVKAYGVLCGIIPGVFGDTNKLIGIVMRYEAGGTLSSPTGPRFQVDVKLKLLADVARGLAELHRVGIIHGDVKPENVLLSAPDETGMPKARLADFGLSDIRDAVTVFDSTIAETKHFKGTPRYSAPEMFINPFADIIDATVAKASRKTDMYSFGILAWEVLADDKPFKEITDIALLGSRLHQGLRPPMSQLVVCPGPVKNMIVSCWDKDRAERRSAVECCSLLLKQFKNLNKIKHGVYLSYHSIYENLARLVYYRLTSFGLRVKTASIEDYNEITSPEDLKQSSVFLVVMSPEYQSSSNCSKILKVSSATKSNGRRWTILTQGNNDSWVAPKTIYFCQLFDSATPLLELPSRENTWAIEDLQKALSEAELQSLSHLIDEYITRNMVKLVSA